MSGHVWMSLLILCLAVFSAGCRRVYTFAPVKGTITQGDKPLAGYQVIFLADPDSGAEGPRSIGTTDENGHYRLCTDSGTEGAVVGKHRVYFAELLPPGVYPGVKSRKDTASSKPKDNPEPRMIPKPKPRDSRVPAIYRSIKETPLRAEVRSGGTQIFDFDIPSKIVNLTSGYARQAN